MLDKLEALEQRKSEIDQLITDPQILSDQKQYSKLMKEYKNLSPAMDTLQLLRSINTAISEAQDILSSENEAELLSMAREELEEKQKELEQITEKIKVILIPKDPEDDKNAILEIRAGTGGDEASIFAGDLFRMFCKYAEDKKWKIDIVELHDGSSGGYKEVIFNVMGRGAYGILKFEAGVHRVQRVPKTETQGRVHTSAASVVVMPEAEEFDISIDMNDIRRDFYCSSGPGGQSVNTTYSAVRLTHIPTGLVAQCQDEKSQHRNFDKALSVLRSRIYEQELQKKMERESAERKSMVSSGDRSAKIRTYNFPQGRVTDHRIGLTLYDLEGILNGNLQKVSDALLVAENIEKLKVVTKN